MHSTMVRIDRKAEFGGPVKTRGWLANIEGIEVAVTRLVKPDGEFSSDTWVVTEPVTGRSIPHSSATTRKRAVENAAATMRGHGIEKVRKLIEGHRLMGQ